MKSRLPLICSLFAFLLVSCVGFKTAEYPPDWPGIGEAKNADCVSLSGVYSNKGMRAPTNYYKSEPSLSEMLVRYIPHTRYFDHKWVDRVEFTDIDNGKLKVTLWENTKQRFQTTLDNPRDVTCTPQYMILTEAGSGSGSTAFAIRTVKKKIGRGVDRSILVSYKETEYGLFLYFIPYWGTMVQRYRYLPADPIP